MERYNSHPSCFQETQQEIHDSTGQGSIHDSRGQGSTLGKDA